MYQSMTLVGVWMCVCVCIGCFSWWSCCLVNIKNENVGRGIGLCSDCDACCLECCSQVCG